MTKTLQHTQTVLIEEVPAVESIRHGVHHVGYWVDDITAEAKRLGALR